MTESSDAELPPPVTLTKEQLLEAEVERWKHQARLNAQYAAERRPQRVTITTYTIGCVCGVILYAFTVSDELPKREVLANMEPFTEAMLPHTVGGHAVVIVKKVETSELP